jgi:hypothetical protein
MTLEHLQSLPRSKKLLQLTHNQLIHIAMENKISIKQVISPGNSQKSNMLDRQQLCTLIRQNSQLTTLQNSVHTIQSIDESHDIQQRVYLNVTQIFSLVSYSNIKLDQLTTCATENIDVSNHSIQSLVKMSFFS